jgi:exportin-2 (importin alpha re-exporter)
MLDLYGTSRDWKLKDAALHLFLAVSVKTSSTQGGAGDLNPLVDIFRIFETHILPEIRDADVNARPIVKADALKLLCILRSHLPASFQLTLLPDIVRSLGSKHVIIQTYAASCIERFLTTKDKDPQTGVFKPRLTSVEIMPFVQSIFAGLFTALANPNLPENDYVMKCIMRVLAVIGSEVGPVTELVLVSLSKTLEKVSKNPVNPHFNHYLFESLALLVRSSCGNGGLPASGRELACARCEALLFPTFQMVLSQDVSEFIPYVFQILAQLLSSRPSDGLSDGYRSLFPPLLMPVLWERKGNIPALADLFKAYISKGASDPVLQSNLQGVLGVFQKLLASKVMFPNPCHPFPNLTIFVFPCCCFFYI